MSLTTALERAHEVGPLLAARAGESEQLGRLADDCVEALHASGLFRMMMPADMGGLELTIPESIEVYRTLATYDASAGWTMAILGNGPLVGRFVDAGEFTGIFGPSRTLLAGSLNPIGTRAEAVDGGFVFSGTATYASGCRHAGWLMAAGLVTRGGEPSFPGGEPELVGGILPMTDVRIDQTWNVTGMRATGSNDCTFADVFVPVSRCFDWRDPVARFGDPAGPLAHIPMLVQLAGGLASSVVGAARGALDAFVELAAGKRPVGSMTVLAERAYAQMAVGEAAGLVTAAEDTLRAAMDEVWAQGVEGRAFTHEDRVRLRLRTGTSVRLSKRAVDMLRDAAGMNAVAAGSRLERAWRDVHTASQHVLLSVGRVEIIGRILLGLDAGSLVI